MDYITACKISIAIILFGIGVLAWALVLEFKALRTKGQDVPEQSRKARNERLSLVTIGLVLVVVGMGAC